MKTELTRNEQIALAITNALISSNSQVNDQVVNRAVETYKEVLRKVEDWFRDLN
jgi:hypothetical protein